uniref:Retrotransposon protein, putative, Ty1-copia subclass n=1 Tax=Tanacetum cinerariifolium TaxID=118510 RepID=A0A6L2JXV3_TANCI|nr:hypothetical protein [Tanacetum cinerariifolium]
MHSMGKTIAELHAMLKLHEKGIPKKAETPAVLAIQEGKIQKDKRKPRRAKGKDNGKNKLAYAPEPWIPLSPKRDNLEKDFVCHHCKEGLRRSKNLKHEAFSLYMGNGMRTAIEAIGSFDLISGLIIVLDNCHFAPTRDGILQPTHDESLEKCKSYISGKMAHKPFPHKVERAEDLLRLIHTDVCGPFRTMSREGARYSTTFTDDFNRYSYVYLMKYKHEDAFEIWHGKATKLSYLRVWDCEELVKRDMPEKLDHGSIKCIFVGYPRETMGYYFYYPPEDKLFVSRNAESTRIPQVPDRYGFYVDFEEHELGDLNELPNYKVALSDPKYDKWLEAMNMKMQSMTDNQVWILVELPLNGRTVGRKWLFKKKTDMDGNVHTFKAHLVVKGYTQTYDVNYEENFSPVADIRAIRILLAIAAFNDYEIWQMDVKTAFLNGRLSKDVYMVQLEGFVDPNHPNKVYSGSSDAFLILYVNDILLMGNNVTMLQEVKSWLSKCFSIKDVEEAAYILEIKIICNRSKQLIALSQSAYLEEILKKFRMKNSKKGYTPMIENLDYRKSQGAKTPSEQNPGEINWIVVKTVLKYLRNTKDMVIVYGVKPEAELKKSAKQSTNAMSSTKAEYIAAAEASMEAIWIRKFIDGLGDVVPSNKRLMEMLCDNEPAIAIAIAADPADPFTKPMMYDKHYEHAMVIGSGEGRGSEVGSFGSGLARKARKLARIADPTIIASVRTHGILWLVDLDACKLSVQGANSKASHWQLRRLGEIS